MEPASLDRVRHVKRAISDIRQALLGLSFEQARTDPIRWAAFERFLEVLSEASRNISAAWKEEFGQEIPWSKVANLGNTLRHAYHRANQEVLWSIYENDLDPLEAAIDAMLAAHGE